MEFAWNRDKATANERKHGVSFAESTPPAMRRGYVSCGSIDADIAEAFPDEVAVNAALRQFLAEHPRETAR